jgi:Xaa-Pro aminopeptidase
MAEFPTSVLRTPGHRAVDTEERVDFDRLRRYRLGRAREALEASPLGALLCFDVNNVRYLTATAIGEWARDKFTRYCLLARDSEPILWDFGSAARHHRLYAPWLEPANSRAGLNGMRGAIPPEAGLFERCAKEIKAILVERGVADLPLGVDVIEMPLVFALAAEGLQLADAQQVLLAAREIKSADEITLLSMACAMVDGAYQLIADVLKPGIRECDIVGLVNKRLYELGSDDVEAVNAISGERCNPHPHNFTDRIIRPGDQAFFDIIQSYNGYRTCYYRTLNVGRATSAQRDAYTQARAWIDEVISMIKPGASSSDIALAFPAATEFGFEGEMEAFGLQFCHGLGLGLHERPLISRLHSAGHPVEIKPGMVFAVETYCPATDGVSAARIEEEVVVTEQGAQVITLFPAEELFVANAY